MDPFGNNCRKNDFTPAHESQALKFMSQNLMQNTMAPSVINPSSPSSSESSENRQVRGRTAGK